jgi:hypothetical protein
VRAASPRRVQRQVAPPRIGRPPPWR